MAVAQRPVETVEWETVERSHSVFLPARPGLDREGPPRAGGGSIQTESGVCEVEEWVHLWGFIQPVAIEGIPHHVLQDFIPGTAQQPVIAHEGHLVVGLVARAGTVLDL